MANQLSETKIWKAITAVASSIMTNLLCNFVSNESYVLRFDGAQYVITSDADSMRNNAVSFIGILLLFFILWGCLLIMIQIATKLTRQLKYRKMKFHSRNDLMTTVNEAKKTAIDLMKIYFDEQDLESNMDVAVLQFRTLAGIVSSLHVKFVPYNKQRKKHMKDNFRQHDHSSILNITRGVSNYEFLSLIQLLQKMAHNMSLHTNDNQLMQKDCLEMLKMLKDLECLAYTMK